MTAPTGLAQKLKPWFSKVKSAYVPGLSFDTYAGSSGLNASILKQPTAADMRHELLRVEEKLSYAFSLGEAVHKAVLEPDLFDGDGVMEYFQYSPTKGLDTIKAREALAADPGRPLVTPEILDKARFLRDAIYCHRFAAKLLRGKSQRELSGFAWDEEHGLVRKIRVDFLPAGPANYMLDIKTMQQVDNKAGVLSIIRKFGYALQAAWYLDTHKLITGESRELFYIVAASGPMGNNDGVQDEPYKCRVFEINGAIPADNLVYEGREKYEDKVGVFLDAAHNGSWGAYEHEEPILLTSNITWKK